MVQQSGLMLLEVLKKPLTVLLLAVLVVPLFTVKLVQILLIFLILQGRQVSTVVIKEIWLPLEIPTLPA